MAASDFVWTDEEWAAWVDENPWDAELPPSAIAETIGFQLWAYRRRARLAAKSDPTFHRVIQAIDRVENKMAKTRNRGLRRFLGLPHH